LLAGTDANFRLGRRWSRQRHDEVLLGQHADRAAQPPVETRVELANAMFDYVEIFYNRQRRRSDPQHRTPIEYEIAFENQSIPA
jgi:Integrase core domain